MLALKPSTSSVRSPREKVPAQAKQIHKAEARTLEIKKVHDLSVALLAASERKGVRPSTLTFWRWLLRKHIGPKLGHYRTLELTRKLVRPVLQEIGAESGPVTSNRSLTLLKRMYNFAVEEELIEHNPLAALKFAFNETSRDRVLSMDEIQKVWSVLELIKSTPPVPRSESHQLGVSPSMALAIQLCLYTCQRGGEVAGMRRKEVDLDTLVWVLPASRTKSKRENLVPLSPQAAALIRQAITLAAERYGRPLEPEDAVFPSPRAKRK